MMGYFEKGLLSINWLGLAMGILMLVLPFLGPWWSATAGTGAMVIAFSPFDMYASFLGLSLQSSLVGIFLLFAKIAFVLAGIFMIIGSIFAELWWGKRLVRYGVMKPFWSVIGLIVMVLIGAFAFNNVLPGIISGAAGGGATVQLSVPYISGTTVSTIQIGTTATITAPITASLTGAFWVAVGVAALGIVTRIYQRKLSPKKLVIKPAEQKVIKVKPAGEKKVIKIKPAEPKKVIKVKPAKKTLKLKAK